MNVLAMEDELTNPTEAEIKEYLPAICAGAAATRASCARSKGI